MGGILTNGKGQAKNAGELGTALETVFSVNNLNVKCFSENLTEISSPLNTHQFKSLDEGDSVSSSFREVSCSSQGQTFSWVYTML